MNDLANLSSGAEFEGPQSQVFKLAFELYELDPEHEYCKLLDPYVFASNPDPQAAVTNMRAMWKSLAEMYLPSELFSEEWIPSEKEQRIIFEKLAEKLQMVITEIDQRNLRQQMMSL